MKITYKGVKYKSKRELYKAYGLTEKTVLSRINRGMSLDEALAMGESMKKPVRYGGKTYKSIRELAEAKNMSLDTVIGRRQKGLSLDDAVGLEVYYDRVHIKHKDKIYHSMLDFASEFDLDYKIMRKAVKMYKHTKVIDGTELLSVIQNWGKTDKVTLWGRVYSSYVDVAKSFGLDYTLLVSKITTSECSIDKIVGEMLNFGIVYQGVHYKGLADLCSKLGRGYGMVYARITKGWDFVEAIETPKSTNSIRKNTINYRGCEYYSKEEVCSEYGFSPTFVRSVANRIGKDFFYALDLLVSFFGELDCEKPPIISRPPYNIYNGLWCVMEKDFCDACNVKLIDFRNSKGSVAQPSSFDYMRKYTEVKSYRYYFKGKLIKRTNLEVEAKKNSMNLKDFLNSPEFKKVEELKHPESSFKETGLCHDTFKEFSKLLEKHKAKE